MSKSWRRLIRDTRHMSMATLLPLGATLLSLGMSAVLYGQNPSQTSRPPQPPAEANPGNRQQTSPASTSPKSGKEGAQGGESKSASGKTDRISPIAPGVPPARVFSRPRIGLALGGGGALGLSEVGVLQWFEEKHIPVDEIAGTSMGCLVASLYSSGRTPDQLSHVVNGRVFTSVFSFSESYNSRSFRRREESRELPNSITVGLKHRISFRNAVLVDQGLNAFLDREFLRYDDRTDFNTLPIPLRCMATDLNEAKPVMFARGSLPDAVRASVSIPGIFPPFEMNGHEYVDGVVLENLPTRAVREMQPDVVLAVSLPLAPVGQGELGSILGVFGRAFAVATEALEDQKRKLADVVITPDITGYTVTDYLKSDDLISRGYRAANDNRDKLLKYAVSDADWAAYLAHRNSLIRGPAAPVLRVRVTAPDRSSMLAIQRLFAPLVNAPVDTSKIEAMLDQVRSDGAFDADYTVGYETPQQFAAQTSGAAPLPPDAVAVTAATTLSPDQAAAAPNPPADSGSNTDRRPGAPNQKPGTSPSSDQPGVPRSDGASAPSEQQAPVREQPSLASAPGAPGLNNTQEVTAESLSDIGSRPIILVNVTRKKTGPPFLLVGANVEAQTSAPTRATIEAVLLDQDFGGYGSELRSRIKLGYVTELGTEYFRPLNPLSGPEHTLFLLPHTDFLRQPFPIYNQSQGHLADRQLQRFVAGGDFGWTNQRTQQLRAGVDFQHLHWETTSGSDGKADFTGNAERAHLRYDFDTQDRALVPQYGLHLTGELAYLFAAVASPDAPSLYAQASYAHRFGLHRVVAGAPKDPNRGHEVFILAGEGGTYFRHDVADPFRFTLGGPLRLSASAIDQYRGTDYWLIEPALLRRLAQLPQPLGQSIYIGLGAEAAQIRAPGVPVINRQDAYFGVVAETPLGVITLAPAIGSNGERKLVFTLGKIF